MSKDTFDEYCLNRDAKPPDALGALISSLREMAATQLMDASVTVETIWHGGNSWDVKFLFEDENAQLAMRASVPVHWREDLAEEYGEKFRYALRHATERFATERAKKRQRP
jgi:hypothetical protein